MIAQLLSKLTSALANAPPVASDGLLSITLALPGHSWSQFSASLAGYRYCACPESQRILLGYGAVTRLIATGNSRFTQIRHPVQMLQRNWIQLDPENTGLQPHALLVFAFNAQDAMTSHWAGTPNTVFEVPAVLLQQRNGCLGITFTCRPTQGQPDAKIQAIWRQAAQKILENLSAPSPNCLATAYHNKPLERIAAHPDAATWLGLVRRARYYIRNRTLHKVVLTRHIRVQGSHRFDPALVMGHLAVRYPNCAQIALDMNLGTAGTKRRVLVAATPERLMTVRAGAVICEALAGTITRIPNANGICRQDQMLLASAKGRHEHALVVEHMATALREYCTDVQVPDNPKIMSLRFVHHLHSIITGRLTPASNLLDILERLHPTPAVGGTPTMQALNWLNAHEPLQRGWYTGVVGWMTPDGDGEFVVLLRCALLNGAQADLFAGAGIVEGSEPVAELEETELKLHTMLEVLQDV